ncbi:MAG: topoisomerase IV, partial [Oscillospiraceae bacterium]|nr:topoisomerase IV [Oscillospiraceae bacterium]
KILLDIDKAVRIVRESETETEVVPNLMIGFGIDQIQAEFVAEIRLRHLNREYILSRTGELNKLDEDIARMEGILKSNAKILGIIVEELNAISKTYGRPRQSAIVYATDIVEAEEEHQDVPDYPCTLFYTAGGYFKKITPQSLRMSAEQKLKEGDTLTQTMETTNSAELLFFGSKGNVYKATAADFADTKASVMGDYIPTKLGFDEGETAVYMAPVGDYSGRMVFFFENGKAAKVELSAYETKQNRRKLINAYSVKSPLAGMFCIDGDKEFLLKASSGKCLLVHTGAVAVKATRDTIGVQAMTIKAGHRVTEAVPYEDGMLLKPDRYRARNLPAAGAAVTGEQMKLEVRS